MKAFAAVKRKVGGSSPPRSVEVFFRFSLYSCSELDWV